ncbi:MAG: TIGR01777 family oxidoreductase [Thermodesulfobacteriota bacterium]
MKIVVTGATGFIGRALVQRLLSSGHEVTAWSRDAARARESLPALCEVAEVDPRRAVDPERLRGVDAVVHLAGESVAGGRWSEERKREIHESRVASSRAIVDAIATLPAEERPRALVAASAVGYYGDRGDAIVDETSGPGDGFLADLCVAWEGEVRRAEALGVRVAVVRIGVVLGRDGGALQAMLAPFRLGVGGRVGSGAQWMSWIHLDDLVSLFHFALENDQVAGVLNGVAPNPVTNAEFTRELGRVLGRPTLLPVPAAALRLMFGEMASILLEGQRVLPRRAQELGFTFLWPTVGPALAEACGDTEHELVFEQWVPRPPQEVFPFFSDARNLEKITPAFLGFHVLDVKPEPVTSGTVIDYKLTLRGVPLRWRSVIEEWEPGRRFSDRQVRGPYRSWHHTHEFEPVRGGTLLRDRVRYAVPLGALGETLGGGLVRRDVERIFAFRRKKIEEMFGRPAGSGGDEQRGHAA